MKVRYHLTVSGQVQGVGFRYYIIRCAMKQGIFGWVRNDPDGTVGIEAEGAPEDMGRFLADVHKGSSFSSVRHVEEEKLDDLKGYSSFKII